MIHECQNTECRKEFASPHSTAKYCSRKCAATVNISRRPPAKGTGYSDEHLIGCLKRLRDELGRPPKKAEIRARKDVPSVWTYGSRFGSFTEALAAAGMEVPKFGVKPNGLYRREPVSASLRFTVLERDGFRCQYCGGTPQLGYVLTVDHVIPVSKGGKNTADNLRAACSHCNNGRGSRLAKVVQS